MKVVVGSLAFAVPDRQGTTLYDVRTSELVAKRLTVQITTQPEKVDERIEWAEEPQEHTECHADERGRAPFVIDDLDASDPETQSADWRWFQDDQVEV